MTHDLHAAAAADAFRHFSTLSSVPLTLRYQLAGDTRLQARKPLRITFPLASQTVAAEVLYGRNGSCIFFRLDLGALPFTAQGPEARQQVLTLMHNLKRDPDYLSGDITLLKNPTTGLLAIRSSAVMSGRPGVYDLINEMVRFAQAARPYLEVLQPLLGQR